VERHHQKGPHAAEGNPSLQAQWLLLDADQSLRLYDSILRGLLHDYRFMNNLASLSRI
jgi:hypothetical protein